MLNFRSFVIVIKVVTRHILSFALALLVLFSTISFTVDMHFCGQHLVDVSLFKKAENCGMAAMMFDSMNGQMNMDMDCCSDFNLVQQGQDDLKVSFEKINFDSQLFVVTFLSSYMDLFTGTKENNAPHNEYPPPLLIKDVILLDQQFLI